MKTHSFRDVNDYRVEERGEDSVLVDVTNGGEMPMFLCFDTVVRLLEKDASFRRSLHNDITQRRLG